MQKIEWMLSLKVGDTVCDCRFKHLKIASIEDVYLTVVPEAYLTLIRKLPYVVFNWCYDIGQKYLGKKKLIDKDVILEDGNSCSIMYCCDPIDHDISYHTFILPPG